MIVNVLPDKVALGLVAAERAAAILRETIAARGEARIVAATGASQIEFLAALTRAPGIDWKRVELFHLDEYLGLPGTHPASFRRYLRERLIGPVGIERHHLVDVDGDVRAAIDAVSGAVIAAPIDLAFGLPSMLPRHPNTLLDAARAGARARTSRTGVRDFRSRGLPLARGPREP